MQERTHFQKKRSPSFYFMVLKPGYLENKGALFESFGELGVTLSLQSSLSFRYGHVYPVFIMRFRQQDSNHVSIQFNLHPVSNN